MVDRARTQDDAPGMGTTEVTCCTRTNAEALLIVNPHPCGCGQADRWSRAPTVDLCSWYGAPASKARPATWI